MHNIWIIFEPPPKPWLIFAQDFWGEKWKKRRLPWPAGIDASYIKVMKVTEFSDDQIETSILFQAKTVFIHFPWSFISVLHLQQVVKLQNSKKHSKKEWLTIWNYDCGYTYFIHVGNMKNLYLWKVSYHFSTAKLFVWFPQKLAD